MVQQIQFHIRALSCQHSSAISIMKIIHSTNRNAELKLVFCNTICFENFLFFFFYFQLESPSYFSSVIVLSPLNVTGNLSNLVSAEYKVTSIRSMDENNGSKMVVIVCLQRDYGYHLSTTYSPTLTLVIVVECTLFFKPGQLKAATGFSLTIMLVLYTYIQGITHDIPMTSYLKFIDYWLIFCLFTPIGIFLIEVGWLLNFYTHKEDVSDHQHKIPFQSHIRISFLLTTFFFVSIYTILATVFYQ